MVQQEYCSECGAFMESNKCPKCGYTLRPSDSAPLRKRILGEIRLSKTGNGKPIIALEQEGLYLDLEQNHKTWNFTIRDFRYPSSPHCTFTVRLDNPQKLITSKFAKPIRDTLQTLYEDHHQALNQILQLIQQNTHLFQAEQDPDEEDPPKEETPAEAIVRIAEEHGLTLFRDQFNEPCTYLKTSHESEKEDVRGVRDANPYTQGLGKTHTQKTQKKAVCVSSGAIEDRRNVPNVIEVWQVHRLRTRFVSDYLSGLLYRETGMVIGKDQMNSAISVLAAKAQEKPQICLYNRVAPDGEGGVWLDMSNDCWEAIHVTQDGWEIAAKPPVLFRRYPHQKPMIRPAQGGSLAALLDFCNLTSVDDQLLYLAIMVHYLVPGFPHIGLSLWGTHGSVKSTQQRIVKSLIDPSSVGLLSMPGPNDMNELIQQLDHHYLAFYDNVTSINDTQSDTLCRAITGIGHQRRKLYTDDEAYMREFIRCVNLNGVNVPVENPDLLNRLVVLECPHLPEAYRRPEKELEVEFREKAPMILGAMLDTVVKAFIIYPKVEEKVRRLPRMADATLWCCAITEALGIEYEFFLNAYRANIGEVEASAVRSSPIGEALLTFLEAVLKDKDTVAVTTNQLLATLRQYAEAEGQDLKRGGFPPDPIRLSKELNKVKVNLPKLGYHLRDEKSGSARRKVFNRIKSSKLTDDYTSAQSRRNIWGAEDLRHVLDPENYRRDGSRKQGEKQVHDYCIPEWFWTLAEPTLHGASQKSEALNEEPAEAEAEPSSVDEAGRSVNVRDLYEKARRVLEETGGWLWAGEFWDSLKKLCHPRKLRAHSSSGLSSMKRPLQLTVRSLETRSTQM